MATNGNGSTMETTKLAQIISQTSLATLILAALVTFMYLTHQRELTEHANQKALFTKLVETNDRMATAAEEEVIERRKQAEALKKQSELLDQLVQEWRRK